MAPKGGMGIVKRGGVQQRGVSNQASTDDRLRVLILAGWYPNPDDGLAGIFVREQAEALAVHCDVSVIYVHLGGADEPPLVSTEESLTVVRSGVKVNASARSTPAHLRNLWRLTVGLVSAVVRAYAALAPSWGSPDIVHAHVFYPAGVSAWALSLLHGLPYVVTEHSTEFLPQDGGFWRIRGRVLRFLMRRSGSRARRVIAVGSALGRSLVTSGLCRRVDVVPNVVAACPGQTPCAQIDHRRIAHLSALSDRQKNVTGLIDAAALLAASRADFVVEIAGDGPDREMLEAHAVSRGVLGSRVRFLGALTRDEASRFLGTSAFLVVSSRFETFSVVGAESLMCGRPVLSTRCGGPEDYLTEDLGMLVDEGDPRELADAMGRMLDHHSDFDPVHLRARARTLFSAEAVRSTLMSIYEQAV
jgi:glycosyltransferase involved in cell wall biosynthesis